MTTKEVTYCLQGPKGANFKVRYVRIGEVWDYFITGPLAFIDNGLMIGFTKRHPSEYLSKLLIKINSK